MKVEFDYTRSLGPVLSGFMTGLRDRQILGGRTSDGKVVVPPPEFDPITHEEVTELVPVADIGVVQTWAWVSDPVADQPLDRPFAFALILLDGADTPMLHAVDAGSADAMATGMRVRARWADETVGRIGDIACFVKTVVEERGTTVVEERGTTVVEERGTSVSKPVSKPPPRWLRSEGRASRNHHHGPFGPFEPFETVAAQPPQEPTVAAQPPQPAWGPTRRVPFGTFFHARSGDKGGDANIGVWVGEGDKRAERVAWLLEMLTPDRVRELLPESRDLDVEVFALPNLGAVNVLVRGLLGDGVAASTRFDPQAKAVAEWLRSRPVEIPEELL